MKWVDGEIENFMSLKKPDSSFGFYSDASSDLQTFVDGLQGDMEGLYTGIMGRVAAEKHGAFLKAVDKLMKDEGPAMAENDWEAYFSIWKKYEYSFFILAEFGTNDHLCSKLKKLVRDSALFEEGSVNADELDALTVPEHLKEDLRSLQR